MLTCWLSELVDTIERASVPKWLHEYVQQHRAEMHHKLESVGTYVIPMPDGGQIIIQADHKIPLRRPIRPNCF